MRSSGRCEDAAIVARATDSAVPASFLIGVIRLPFVRVPDGAPAACWLERAKRTASSAAQIRARALLLLSRNSASGSLSATAPPPGAQRVTKASV